MSRKLVVAATAFSLALGFACPAFADDAAAAMKDMMDNHKAMLNKMAEMSADMSAAMDAHAKMMKGDKTQKEAMTACTSMAKEAKTMSVTYKKMATEMDKMKDMKPMDMSKPDPKMQEMMGKMAQNEKDMIAIMQKDLDMMAKMAPAGGAAPAAPAPAPAK